MDKEQHRLTVRQMFDRTAARYVARIDPAFRPIVDSLVAFAFANNLSTERVVDLGTGSGLAAIASAPNAELIIGLDYSEALLRQAQAKLDNNAVRHVHFVQGDMHLLGLATASFDVVLGSFSLNSTNPTFVFPEAFRILQAGGIFAIQEWGAQDEDGVSSIVFESLAEYKVDDPPEVVAALREAMTIPDAWDELEGVEDVVAALEDAGFAAIEVQQETNSVRFDDIDAFLNYKLAWASRYDEIEAMPKEQRLLLFSELHDRLEPHCDVDGSLEWNPGVVRIRCMKPVQ